MKQPAIFSVILNTNRRQDTLECLQSLAENSYANQHIIVLDNSSTDGSVEAIQAAFPDVQLLQLADNRGYAGNNNVGIAAAVDQGADWVLVLNEDTVLAPDCLEKLAAAGESSPNVGIVGPLVYHHDHPTIIQSAGGVLGPRWESIHLAQDEADRGQFCEDHPVEWISGCAIMVRREAIEEAGMIDERYFYYWEETEWCIRIGRAGWQILHVPRAHLWHKGVTLDHQPKPSVTYYATRNRLLTLAKHQAPAAVRLQVWGRFMRTLISWSIRPKWRDKKAHRYALRQGMIDFLAGRWGQRSAPLL
ncbi:MAG: glycosyltransferase family 2 protein [Ardenticatenaceae bacterium]|nr:glycosyltransferase family 2 protein [Ardenticatenaceae bacterium]